MRGGSTQGARHTLKMRRGCAAAHFQPLFVLQPLTERDDVCQQFGRAAQLVLAVLPLDADGLAMVVDLVLHTPQAECAEGAYARSLGTSAPNQCVSELVGEPNLSTQLVAGVEEDQELNQDRAGAILKSEQLAAPSQPQQARQLAARAVEAQSLTGRPAATSKPTEQVDGLGLSTRQAADEATAPEHDLGKLNPNQLRC